jgi:steroid 5-alpha reductase family enzyme
MDFFSAYKVAAAVAGSLMTSLWLCSLLSKDASIVDRFWGMGFVLMSWAIFLVCPQNHPSTSLLLGIVTIWGLRLSIYIHTRNRGHGEDYRYRAMRANHGARFWWYSFLSVFCLQGVLMLVIAAPLIYVISQTAPASTTAWAAVGTIFWVTGFIFEAGGDRQLSRFKANAENKGKLLTTGLWSITRHPNYFGDALQWWGFGVFALDYGISGAATLIGPIVMTIFLRKVSGVDLLEKALKNTKPGYEAYMANTPAFAPSWRFWAALIAISIGGFWAFS